MSYRSTYAGTTICDVCGHDHSADVRLRILRRMLPAATDDIASAYPCIYGTYDNGHGNKSRMLYRDLTAIGAKLVTSPSPGFAEWVIDGNAKEPVSTTKASREIARRGAKRIHDWLFAKAKPKTA